MTNGPTAEQRELLAEVDLGLQAEAFFRSDIGKYMRGRAEAMSVELTEDLKKVDPENAKAVRDLQNKIWLADNFIEWIGELIIGGRNAEQALKQTVDNDE